MAKRGENIRKRKDGRWEGRYITEYSIEGKAVYKSIYGKTYKETKMKLLDVKKDIQNHNVNIQKSKLTFKEILDMWIRDNNYCLKQQTYAKYLYLIKTHIIPDLGYIKIKNLSSEIINDFLQKKAENGRLDGCGGLSASYLQSILFIVKSAIDYSSRKGYIPTFSDTITKPQLSKKHNKTEVLSPSQQKILEEYIFANADERKLGILLSLYTGLRVGEVCGLKWKDIDFDAKLMHIKYTVERIPITNAKNDEPKTELVLGNVKTISSDRIIPIPSRLFDFLLYYKQKDGFVLKGNTYPYTDPRTYQNYFYKCLNACNLKKINYHALRHTFATRCIEAGVDIKSLSEVLGHANTGITLNTYVHSSLDQKRKQLEKLYSFSGQ